MPANHQIVCFFSAPSRRRTIHTKRGIDANEIPKEGNRFRIPYASPPRSARFHAAFRSRTCSTASPEIFSRRQPFLSSSFISRTNEAMERITLKKYIVQYAAREGSSAYKSASTESSPGRTSRETPCRNGAAAPCAKKVFVFFSIWYCA